MAFPLEAWQTALTSVRQGLTANQGLAILKGAGAGVRRETWLTLYRQAVTVVHRARDEPFRPVGSRPHSNEIADFASSTRTGYAQNTALVYRERGTGNILVVRHTTFGQNLVTRETAIQNAVQAYAGTEGEYDQELIGASYASTWRYTPVGG